MAGRLLQTDIERLSQSRQAELVQRGPQAFIHRMTPGGTRKWELRWSGLVKRSQALQRCNLARDSQTWAEVANPGRGRASHRGFLLLRGGAGAAHTFVQPCLPKPSPTEGRSAWRWIARATMAP